MAILGILFIVNLLYWGLGEIWLRSTAPNARRARGIHRGFLVAQALLLAAFLASRMHGSGWSPSFALPAATIYLWQLILLPAATALLLVAVLVVGCRIAWRRLFGRQPSTDAPPTDPSRREFLAASLVAVPPLLTLGATGAALRQIQSFRTRDLTLRLPSLPPPLEGLVICHVSDLHVGHFTGERVLARMVDTVNAMHPDLVVVTGDLVDHSLEDLPAAIDACRKLESRFGTHVIEGNHDLFDGRAAFEQQMRASQLSVLINQATTLDIRGVPVQLLGLRWGRGGMLPHDPADRGDDAIARSAEELFRLRDPAAFPILLAHHPHAFDPAVAAGIPLTLAGHTHGGQLMLGPHTGFGPLMFRYWSGLYTRGDQALVVSNGIGNWFPLRVQAPAELIRITLTGKA